VLSETITISVARSLIVSVSPTSRYWMTPVPPTWSAFVTVYLSVSFSLPALICSNSSVSSVSLIVLAVSIGWSALMAISSPVSSDFM